MAFSPLDRIRSMGLVNKPGMPIAVDFGVSSLKVLQAAPGEKPELPMVLVAAAAIETPEDLLGDANKRLEWQIQQLPKALKAGDFKGKRAVCAIPAGQTFCKHMRFQKTDGLQTAALVKAAVPAQIGCHPDALVYRHVEVDMSVQGGAPTGKSEVICLATSRQLVGRLMGGLRDAKLEPVGMHPECMATIRAFDQITRRAEDEQLTTLYLDLGYGTTKVMIAHGRTLVFAKTIHLGGAQLDQAVARKLGCPAAAARNRRMTAALVLPPVATPAPAASVTTASVGIPALAAAMAKESASGSSVAVEEDRRRNAVAPGLTPELAKAGGGGTGSDIDVSQPLEALTDEIAMCLRYHESIFPGWRVNRSIFVGGEAKHRGLCQQIARTLRLPAQVADPLARLSRGTDKPASGVDLTAPQPGWTVAFGLCVSPTDL